MKWDACKTLWIEVLSQTINDAILGVRQDSTPKDVRADMTRRARDYLTKPNQDFDTICFLIGLEPEAARERLITIVRAAPSPEFLAQKRSKEPPQNQRQSRQRQPKAAA